MVDNIKLPKMIPSVSAAGHINKVKRRQSNTNKEQFEQELREEQKKEEETEEELTAEQELPKPTKKNLAVDDSDSGKDEQNIDTNKSQGKLLDVVV